jgi:hypothetical protein
MGDRNQRRDAKVKRRMRSQLSKLNKETMEIRWKEGKARAYYKKLEQQESRMEIWIGDAVNLCTTCKGVLVFKKDIAIVVDIPTSEKVRVRLSRNTFADISVDKIRFDHRICSGTHLFKRTPIKF